jgi:hypothetical protein
MRHFKADFARRRAVDWRWWWLFVATLALAGWLAWEATVIYRRAELIRGELASIDAASKSASAPQPTPVAALAPYDASAREVLAQHATPWPQLLRALEAVQTDGLRVVSVDYVASESQARVEAAFVQQAAVLEYVASLNAGVPESGFAWRWSVERIEQTRAGNSGRAVFIARWSMR